MTTMVTGTRAIVTAAATAKVSKGKLAAPVTAATATATAIVMQTTTTTKQL